MAWRSFRQELVPLSDSLLRAGTLKSGAAFPLPQRTAPLSLCKSGRARGKHPATALRQLTALRRAATSPMVAACGTRALLSWNISVITGSRARASAARGAAAWYLTGDRKSTRLNSSHITISYAVFCLKNKSVRIIISKLHAISVCNKDELKDNSKQMH